MVILSQGLNNWVIISFGYFQRLILNNEKAIKRRVLSANYQKIGFGEYIMSEKRKIVESVPNYSEGTDGKIVEAIVDEIRNTQKTRIIDIQYDSDYNRAVITFVGEPEAVLQANIAASKKALELIDMTKHKGQHPRIGATDVVPFVPAQNMTMEECDELAKKYAEAMAKEGVPIYLYEESARKPERRNIDNIRVGDYEGLRKTIETNPDHKLQELYAKKL